MISLYLSPKIVPDPTLTITSSPLDEGFYNGIGITLIGRAEFISAVDTPLNVTGSWFKTNPSTNITIDTSRATVNGFIRVRDAPMVYETNLTIFSLDEQRGDGGDFNLRVEITSSVHTVQTTVNTTRNIAVLGKDLKLLCNRLMVNTGK